MATIRYVTKLNDAEVTTLFRQVVDSDGETIISEQEASMQEVRQVDGNALDTYLEAVADRLMEAVVALRDADNRPDENTYLLCGRSYLDLQVLVSRFDKSVLPPSNTL